MFRLLAAHSIITMLAVGIAFAMPEAARYILFQWWPRAEIDAQLLFVSELVLAAALVLLFNAVRMAWKGQRMLRIGQAAALIEVREGGKRFALHPSLSLNDRIPATRDALGREMNAPFQELHHGGPTRQLFLARTPTPRGDLVLLSVFDRATSLGLVRVYFEELRGALAGARPAVPAEPTLAANFEQELNRSLAALFGRATPRELPPA